MKPVDDINTELAQFRIIINAPDFIDLLTSRLPIESLNIDFSNKQFKDALYALLTLFKAATSSTWGIWKVTNPLIPFFDSLAKNDEYAVIVIALQTNAKQTLQSISTALTISNDANDSQLSRLINSFSSKLNNIDKWIDEQFKKFAQLKISEPSLYYSFIYHSALKQKNMLAQNELMTFFHDFEKQLYILRENRGKKFRQLFINDDNIKFWEKFNLMIRHYYDRPKILELISERLLYGTKEENRYQVIESILKSANPLNIHLERYLIAKLPSPEQRTTLRLISSKGTENTQLVDLEFEILRPVTVNDQYKP